MTAKQRKPKNQNKNNCQLLKLQHIKSITHASLSFPPSIWFILNFVVVFMDATRFRALRLWVRVSDDRRNVVSWLFCVFDFRHFNSLFVAFVSPRNSNKLQSFSHCIVWNSFLWFRFSSFSCSLFGQLLVAWRHVIMSKIDKSEGRKINLKTNISQKRSACLHRY